MKHFNQSFILTAVITTLMNTNLIANKPTIHLQNHNNMSLHNEKFSTIIQHFATKKGYTYKVIRYLLKSNTINIISLNSSLWCKTSGGYGYSESIENIVTLSNPLFSFCVLCLPQGIGQEVVSDNTHKRYHLKKFYFFGNNNYNVWNTKICVRDNEVVSLS